MYSKSLRTLTKRAKHEVTLARASCQSVKRCLHSKRDQSVQPSTGPKMKAGLFAVIISDALPAINNALRQRCRSKDGSASLRTQRAARVGAGRHLFLEHVQNIAIKLLSSSRVQQRDRNRSGNGRACAAGNSISFCANQRPSSPTKRALPISLAPI